MRWLRAVGRWCDDPVGEHADLLHFGLDLVADLQELPGRGPDALGRAGGRSEEHTSELQSLRHLVCRLLLEKKKNTVITIDYPRASCGARCETDRVSLTAK